MREDTLKLSLGEQRVMEGEDERSVPQAALLNVVVRSEEEEV